MSRRTRTNLPLPVIGSTGWGGTLNNYLTNQTYAQTELETEIQKIYDNRMNVAQTVLSSGIMDSSVEDFKIGLYEGDNYITEGAILDPAKEYHFRGWAAIVGNQNITQSFDNGDNKLIIPFFDADNGLKFGSATYDARCVYLHYDKSTTTWGYKFGDTNDPSKETKVSVHPYYICLGVVIRINSTNYWHYKTMKSNISISSKKWMLDEPHANLNTYMNWISTSKSLTIHTDNSYFKNAVLTIQALGINPFTETESVTNEYNSDIATYILGKNSETTDNKSYWECVLLYCKKTETTDEDGTTTTTTTFEKKESETNTESLNLTGWVDDSSIYRICASSLIVGNAANTATKPVLFLQKAISGTKIDEALFDESEFGRLMYYADPVELYRIKGNIMTAAVGDGISTINANGINPHVTTLIKNSDDVRFGEDADKYYHLETSGSTPNRALKLYIANPLSNSVNTSYILTNNMERIDPAIRLYSNGGISLESEDDIRIGYHTDTTHFGDIQARYPGEDTTKGGEIKSKMIDGDKLTEWKQTGDGTITIRSLKNKGNFESPITEDPDKQSKIILTPDNIHLHGDSVVPVTKDFQINKGDGAYIAIQYPSTNRPTITLGTNTNKKVRITADGSTTEKPTIELGTIGGDCCKLSSDGLYLPSGSDGVVIDKVQGEGGVNADVINILHTVNKKQKIDSIEIPSLQDLFVTSEAVLNPWAYDTTSSDTFIRDSITDTITVTIDNVDYTLTDNKMGGTWYYSYNGGIAGIDNHTIKVVFSKDNEKGKIYLTGTVKNKTVNSICLPSTITAFKAPLVDIHNITNGTVMHIGDISSSVVHFSNQTSSEAHIFIDKFKHKALKILEKPGGSIVMDECTGGTLSIEKSDTNHVITIGDNRGYTHLQRSDGNDKWLVASGNLITHSGVSQSTRDAVIKAINKISTIDGVVIKKDFWYYRDLPKSSGNRENSESQITIRRFFNYSSEEKNKQDTKTIMLPELRKYTIYIEILDDKFQEKWNIIRTAEVSIDPLNTNTWSGSIPTTSSGNVGGAYKISPHNGHFKLQITYDKWWDLGSIGNWCALITVTEDEDQDNYCLKRLTW